MPPNTPKRMKGIIKMSKKKNSVVIFRVSEYEKKRMEYRAKQRGLTVSEYLRQLVVTNDLKNEKENVNE